MNYYFVASIKIKDEAMYEKYLEQARPIFSKYRGEYLAVDSSPHILEGNWNYSRMVLIRFDTENDFKSWYHSKEYQKILKYRLQAAQCDTVLLKGT